MYHILNRLTTLQLLELVNRYGLKVTYRNPQKRRTALIRALRNFWIKNPVEECAICLEQNSFDNMVITPCSHLFCDSCLISYIRIKENCPMCRKYCSYIEIISQISRERFIQIRAIIQSYKQNTVTENMIDPLIENNHENPNLNINQTHLFIASGFVIIVFLVNIFTICITAHVIINYILLVLYQ